MFETMLVTNIIILLSLQLQWEMVLHIRLRSLTVLCPLMLLALGYECSLNRQHRGFACKLTQGLSVFYFLRYSSWYSLNVIYMTEGTLGWNTIWDSSSDNRSLNYVLAHRLGQRGEFSPMVQWFLYLSFCQDIYIYSCWILFAGAIIQR